MGAIRLTGHFSFDDVVVRGSLSCCWRLDVLWKHLEIVLHDVFLLWKAVRHMRLKDLHTKFFLIGRMRVAATLSVFCALEFVGRSFLGAVRYFEV